MELTGGCLCGAIRYRLSEAPRTVVSCWCRVCQYIGGGSGTVNAVFSASAVSIDGQLNEHLIAADSGYDVVRRFCSVCGTHVVATSGAFPGVIFVRVGTLDDPESVRPSATMWTSSAPSWASIDRTLPCMETQPPPEDVGGRTYGQYSDR
jgi:hypothetical protein